MGKRGRPPHPDILTPREWQVLDLLRQDLTNEQIAHRLDISPATAKYHVSENLSKLDLTTREEAAAWQPEPLPSPFWRRRAFAPLAVAKAAAVAGALAAVAGLALLAWGVLRSGDGEGGVGELVRPVTLLSLKYTLALEEAISQDGMVFHMTVRSITTRREFAGFVDPQDQAEDTQGETEYWIDGNAGLRGLSRQSGGRQSPPVVYTEGRYYYVTEDDFSDIPVSGPGPACHGVDGVVGLLIGYRHSQCPESTEVLTGEFEGAPVIVVKNNWVHTNEDGDPTSRSTDWHYFYESTLLPFGVEGESQSLTGEKVAFHRGSMTVEFVMAGSLPQDLFELNSIAYNERCLAFRIESGGPACYLAIVAPAGDARRKPRTA